MHLEIESLTDQAKRDLFTPTDEAFKGLTPTHKRLLALASAMTSDSLAQPWHAGLLADLCDNQGELQMLRTELLTIAETKGLQANLDKDVITGIIKAQCLSAGVYTQWKAAAAHKPALTNVARTVIELQELRAAMATYYLLAGDGWIPLEKWVAQVGATNNGVTGINMVLIVSHHLAQDGLAAFIPVELCYADNDQSTSLAVEAINGVKGAGTPWGWAVALEVEVKAKPKKKPSETKAPEPVVAAPPSIDQDKAAKMLENIKKMIHAEVQKMLLTNTEALQGIVGAVFAATPGLMEKSVAKLMASTAQQQAINVQIAKSVTSAMAGMDLQKLAEAQVTQQVSGKINLTVLRKEIADKMLTNSDDYFHQVFDRLVVKDVVTGDVIGKLMITDGLSPVAPTLPEAKADDNVPF